MAIGLTGHISFTGRFSAIVATAVLTALFLKYAGNELLTERRS